MSRRGSNKNPGEELKTPGDSGKRRRFDDSGIASTPGQSGGVNLSFDDSDAASAWPASNEVTPEDRPTRRDRDVYSDVELTRPFGYVTYGGEPEFSDIFSKNIVIGENHKYKGSKQIVTELVSKGHHKLFIMEQISKDFQDDIDKLLQGTNMDELVRLKKHIEKISGGHKSDFMPMFNSFCGKGREGVKVVALDREGFDYGFDAGNSEKRIVGMNSDCQKELEKVMRDESLKANVLEGRCVVFCGNAHISASHTTFVEQGIPARLNSVVSEYSRNLNAFFHGVHCRDIYEEKPDTKDKAESFLVGEEFFALFPSAQTIHYELDSDASDVGCVVAVDPSKTLDSKGIIGSIRSNKDFEGLKLGNAFEVSSKLRECCDRGSHVKSDEEKSLHSSDEERGLDFSDPDPAVKPNLFDQLSDEEDRGRGGGGRDD